MEGVEPWYLKETRVRREVIALVVEPGIVLSGGRPCSRKPVGLGQMPGRRRGRESRNTSGAGRLNTWKRKKNIYYKKRCQ